MAPKRCWGCLVAYQFGVPYVHVCGEHAVDVTITERSVIDTLERHATPQGCLGFLFGFLSPSKGYQYTQKVVEPAKTRTITYTNSCPSLAFVWRNVATGKRAGLDLERALSEHFSAWFHRQKVLAKTARNKARVPKKKKKIQVERRSAGINECPYCLSDVNPDTSTVCVSCLARHHVACWDEHGSCPSCNTKKRLIQERA